MSSDYFPKYPKIHGIGHVECDGLFDGEVIIQEKYDGSNVRWMVEDGNLIVGSRNIDMLENPKMFKEKPWSNLVEYLQDRIDLIAEGFVYYGEFIGSINKLRIDYETVIDVVLFDVLDKTSGKFLDYDSVFIIAAQTGFNLVKTYDIQDWKECLEDVKSRKREGIVIKNYDNQIFGKQVLDEFREISRIKKVKSKNEKYGQEESFVESFLTYPRISKMIELGMENGLSLDNTMIPFVIKSLFKDIIIEELPTAVINKKVDSLNFKVLRKLISMTGVKMFKELLNDKLKEKY